MIRSYELKIRITSDNHYTTGPLASSFIDTYLNEFVFNFLFISIIGEVVKPLPLGWQ